MSFILDALKKSESERLRKDAPDFSDVPDRAQDKSSSHWIWIIVVLIGINISVLVVMFLDPDRVRNPVAADTSTESPATAPAPQPFTEIVAVEKRNQPVATEPSPEPATRTTARVAAQNPDPVPAIAISSGEVPVISESIATFNDLRAQGVLQLPDMHLDIHVYSAEPDDRFVFVNMSKYKERATLDEGPVIREITPDGVVLEHLGMAFLLPRE